MNKFYFTTEKIGSVHMKVFEIVALRNVDNWQGRPQDLGGGGQEIFFQIWEFACREATCCAWRSHAHC